MRKSCPPDAAVALQPAGEAAAGWRMVQAAFFAFVLMIPVETVLYFKNERDPSAGGITISWLLGLALFGLALLEPRRCFGKFPAAFWMIAWYVAACAVSQLWIPSALDARFAAHQMTMLQMAALFLISVNLFADARFRGAVLRGYGWWVSLVAAAMVLGYFRVIEGRSSIVSQNPNVTAGMFALGAVCLAGDPRLIGTKPFQPRLVASVPAIAVLILAILQTGSRGGLLVFAAGILALGACAGKTTRARRLLIAGAVVGAVILLVIQEFSQGTASAARLEAAWSHGDTAGRTTIWKTSWAMFLERPYFGYGATNNLFTLGVQLNSPFRDTHNLLLAVLTEVGLVGALPFIGAIVIALRAAWRYGGRTGDGLPFALMAALIALVFPSTAYHLKIFWVVFAAAVACGYEREDAGAGAGRV